MSDDPNLAVQSARTDPESLGALLLTTKADLQRTIRTFLRKRRTGSFDSSDVFQQTVASAIGAWPGFRGTTRLELMAWLRTIARRLAMRKNVTLKKEDQVRRLKLSRDSTVGISLTAQAELTVLESIVMNEELVHLQECLSQLPQPQQDILRWRHNDNLSFQEIAHKSAKSNAAVRMVYLRALKRLQELTNAKADSARERQG